MSSIAVSYTHLDVYKRQHITCALKNMKGLLPNKEKRRFHAEGLHRPIAHLALGIHQDFILVDSICGDLSFEDGGNPTRMDRLMAAADPVLMDAYVCQLLGYEVEEVPYVSMAEELGAGSTDLTHAEIRELNAPIHPMGKADKDRVMKLAEIAQEVAVSYTHLDVYKRQRSRRSGFRARVRISAARCRIPPDSSEGLAFRN